MGGVSTLALAHGTPEEVRGEAIRKCREGGPDGYVLQGDETSILGLCEAIIHTGSRPRRHLS
jgi:hypothetical protein